uniref:Uncharacterized protein n=1 Tax=Anopheles culicifacies TaxID=139723 RepID=A0A182MRB6_9DIPT
MGHYRWQSLLFVLLSSLIWQLVTALLTLDRQERAALVFPRGSSMGYLLAIAIPLLVPGRNIYLSHNFEANYGVPSNVTQYFLWYQRFKDNSFNITKAIETNRRRRELQPGFSRTYFYDQLEERMDLYGFNATGCMERLICEVAELPLGEHNGVFGDVLSVIFSVRPADARNDVVKSRQKRIVFPVNAAMGIIFALAIPLGIPSRNIFMSYNFEGNYNSPADANIFTEGFANYIKGIVEPLTAPSVPVETYGIRKRSVKEVPSKSSTTTPQITRRKIYKMLQQHLQSQHFNGRKCLKRMICEAALHPFSETNGVVGDMVQILLSPSSSMDESLPKEYLIAEKSGHEAASQPQNTSNHNSVLPESVDEGRFLIRGKPILVYPPTAPTRHQLIVGIGVPVQDIPHSVVFGWVLKAQYYLPSVPGNYEPINLDNWNDSRRAFPDRHRRSIERYEVDDVRVKVEPLPQQQRDPMEDEYDYYGDELDNDIDPVPPMDTESVHKDAPKQEEHDGGNDHPEDYNGPNGRWTVYKAIEGLSSGYGFGGRACVLRSICEAAETQFTHTGGVFAELLHIMLSPSTTNEPVSEHRDNEYYRAEQLGLSGAPCATIFHECSTSLLDMFSGVHDLHGTMAAPK